jgi:hypothetical protein
MVAGTAAEIGIAGTAGATISSLWRGAAACNENHMKGRLRAAGAHDQATEDRELARYAVFRPIGRLASSRVICIV